MVIIIGGASHTGKTLMAQMLLSKFGIPYLSVDHLKMGLYRAGKNCGFSPDDSDEVIEEKLWGIIKGIIYTNIENKQNIIIEGCYIFPHRLKELADISEQIIPIFIGFSKTYIDKYFDTRIQKNRNAIEHRATDEKRTKEEFISENEKVKQRCFEAGVKYIEISSNYRQGVGRAHMIANRGVGKLIRAGKAVDNRLISLEDSRDLTFWSNARL